MNILKRQGRLTKIKKIANERWLLLTQIGWSQILQTSFTDRRIGRQTVATSFWTPTAPEPRSSCDAKPSTITQRKMATSAEILALETRCRNQLKACHRIAIVSPILKESQIIQMQQTINKLLAVISRQQDRFQLMKRRREIRSYLTWHSEARSQG